MQILRQLRIFTLWRGDGGFIGTPVMKYAQSRELENL